jgi:hypothetical protein
MCDQSGKDTKIIFLIYQINTIYLCYTNMFKECVIHVKTKKNVCNYPITLATSTLIVLFQKYWNSQKICEEKYLIFNRCQSCQGIMYFCKDIKSIFSISYKPLITRNLSFYIIGDISYMKTWA